MWLVVAIALFYGPYNATVEEVINAETLRLNVAIWPGEEKVIEIGVLGVDTPSLVGNCDAEELLALDAMEMTRVFVGNQTRVTDVRLITSVEGDQNNRKIYAKIRNKKGQLLSEALIKSGYGVPFEKGKQTDWCH